MFAPGRRTSKLHFKGGRINPCRVRHLVIPDEAALAAYAGEVKQSEENL